MYYYRDIQRSEIVTSENFCVNTEDRTAYSSNQCKCCVCEEC